MYAFTFRRYHADLVAHQALLTLAIALAGIMVFGPGPAQPLDKPLIPGWGERRRAPGW